MEEAQAVQFSEDDVGEDFYETIEAPKFVDFTVSDPYRPDDLYWFCSRVGCDTKHPEEMDSEVVYKNFVMRVMAARSPNVRLHKARRNLKCPLTAPPKSSKSRVSRLALISSISKRIADARVKSKPPPPKPSATPNVKPKQAHFKAMTTPRNREPKSNPKAFLSVRNPKSTLTEVPKTRIVAKALVFQSPRKNTENKTSVEMNTPVKTLCAAMKKLEITSAKKNDGGNPLSRDVSRKKFRGREVKSRVFDSLGIKGCKLQDGKSAGVLKKKSKEKSLKSLHDHVHHESVDEDASDMDISRHVSMDWCSLSHAAKRNEGNKDEELMKIVEPALNEKTDHLLNNSECDEISISNSEESDCKLVLQEVEDKKNQDCNREERMKSGAIEMNTSEFVERDDKEIVATSNERNRDEELSKTVEHALDESTDNLSRNSNCRDSLFNSAEKNLEESYIRLVPCKVEKDKNQECNHEDRMQSGAVEVNISELECDNKENVARVNKENAAADDGIENGSETTANDENENVAPYGNSGVNSYNLSGRVTFGNPKNSINAAKVTGILSKSLKENSTPSAPGSHGLKISRSKPTNPKPFRLRTDERGILREANLEKKCPLKDITTCRRFCRDKQRRENQCMNQKSEKCLNKCDSENRAKEDNEQKVSESKYPDDGRGGTVPVSSNTIEGDPGCKSSTMDLQHCTAFKHQKQNLIACHEPGKETVTKKIEVKFKRTNLEKMQQNIRKPKKRDASFRKEIISQVPPCQTSSKMSTYKNATKPSKSSQGRRPAIIPKEPNLHSCRLPKCCSRKLA